MTVVAIHQPNYFPWLGFFQKADAADTFILLDHVQHTRQSLTRRTYIRKQKNSSEKSLLSIPLRDHARFSPINELRISGVEWTKLHRDKLNAVYRNSKYLDFVNNNILDRFDQFRDGDLLSQINWEMFRVCCTLIGLTVNNRLSSRMQYSTTGSKLMAELTELEGGSAYYSGGGAGDYTDEGDFGARGLAISYQRFSEYTLQAPYEQKQGNWLPGLSVLDALSNIGPVATLNYIRDYRAWAREQPMEQDLDPLLKSNPSPLF